MPCSTVLIRRQDTTGCQHYFPFRVIVLYTKALKSRYDQINQRQSSKTPCKITKLDVLCSLNSSQGLPTPMNFTISRISCPNPTSYSPGCLPSMIIFLLQHGAAIARVYLELCHQTVSFSFTCQYLSQCMFFQDFTKDCVVYSDRRQQTDKENCPDCFVKHVSNPGINPGLCFQKFYTILNYK